MKMTIEQLIQKASRIKTSQRSQHTDIREILLGILDILDDANRQSKGSAKKATNQMDANTVKPIQAPKLLSDNMKKADKIIKEYQKQQMRKGETNEYTLS